MPQYEIKSGNTLYMTNASSSIEAIYKFKQSCGDMAVDVLNCIGNISVLDNVSNKFNSELEIEKGRESYFDYWKPPINGNN